MKIIIIFAQRDNQSKFLSDAKHQQNALLHCIHIMQYDKAYLLSEAASLFLLLPGKKIRPLICGHFIVSVTENPSGFTRSVSTLTAGYTSTQLDSSGTDYTITLKILISFGRIRQNKVDISLKTAENCFQLIKTSGLLRILSALPVSSGKINFFQNSKLNLQEHI